MRDLVELEMRELLTQYGFDGSGSPVIFGSALQALEVISALCQKSKSEFQTFWKKKQQALEVISALRQKSKFEFQTFWKENNRPWR